MIHRGKYVILYVGGLELAYSDSCTFDANAEMVELSPDVNGGRRYIPNLTDANINTSGLMGINDSNELGNQFNLLTILKTRQRVTFDFVFEETGNAIRGRMYCDNFNTNGAFQDYSTFSASFVVDGDYTVT